MSRSLPPPGVTQAQEACWTQPGNCRQNQNQGRCFPELASYRPKCQPAQSPALPVPAWQSACPSSPSCPSRLRQVGLDWARAE